MNDIITSIILGIVQGITEFLPISSDGHLELAKFILGSDHLNQDGYLIITILHFGTALAIFYVFYKDIIELLRGIFIDRSKEALQFALLVIISMIPAAIVGLFFEEEMESLFTGKIGFTCFNLFITGLILVIAEKMKPGNNDIKPWSAFLIGIFQAIAILPGISRSGSTISSSLALGIDKTKATKFSFLMVLPLIFGKMAKDIKDGALNETNTSMLALFLGFICSFVVGIWACRWMIKAIKSNYLHYFGYYCIAIGIFGMLYMYFQ